jgi:hypothetical protein
MLNALLFETRAVSQWVASGGLCRPAWLDERDGELPARTSNFLSSPTHYVTDL